MYRYLVSSENAGYCRYQVVAGVLLATLELPHAWCMLLHKVRRCPNVIF